MVKHGGLGAGFTSKWCELDVEFSLGYISESQARAKLLI